MSTPNAQTEREYGTKGVGTQMPFSSINEPGAYICSWSGHLLRVPEDSIKPGRSPVMDLQGTEPLFVTKITDDPFVPISKARIVAANYDIAVNF